MIELLFNPYTESGTKAMFQGHPVVAKFYLLWRQNHLTDQHFVKRCQKLMQSINPKLKQYNIDEFIQALRNCGLCCRGYSFGTFDEHWVLQHWDYFSPHLRRSLEFQYKFRHKKKTSVII